MYQLKQKTDYFFKVWSSHFQPTVFLLPIVQPCSLLYLFKYFHYILLPLTLQNKRFPSSLSQYLTYLPTSTWKSLLRHPSAIVRAGTGLPQAEEVGTRPEAETSHADGARRAGIVVGAAGMLCGWEVMATGREEPRRSYPPQTSAPARQSAWRMVLHQPCIVQPDSSHLPQGLVFEVLLQRANGVVIFLRSLTWVLCIIFGAYGAHRRHRCITFSPR